MVQLSKFNNIYTALNASSSFVGQLESTADLVSISVNVHCEQACRIIIKQYRARDLTTQVQENAEDVAADTRQVVQTPIKAAFYDIEVVNLAVVDMSFTRVTTYLQSTHYVNLDIRKLTEETDKITTISGDSKTSTGDIIINGSSGSATRPVYLMNVGTWYRVASVGNTPGHVWNAIGAIVGGETIPTVGRLFKCLSAPGNIEGQGTVYDVEYSDTITATPVGTQDVNIVSSVTVPVSGSVSLLPAADPTLTIGTTRMNDGYGNSLVTTAGNLMVGINNIYTANPLHTIVDSGSVVVTTLPAITLSKTTSSITAWENPSSIISFDSGNTVRQIKSSAGSLQSLSLVNDNNSLAFVALYDLLAGSVTAGTTAPLAVIVIQKDQAIQLVTHNLNFSVALSFYVATTYNGATPLTNVYLTAAYNS